MPELPEVETVVRDLRPCLTGCRIQSVTVSGKPLRRPWSPEWQTQLVGRHVRHVRRRGKWIVVELDRERFLVVHLGMSGQLTVVPAAEAIADHTHIVLNLSRNRTQLRFRDIRRFGSATLFEGRAVLERFFSDSDLGPEPWDLDTATWRQRLAATERCLKAVLLDQRIVAGVGNIYADESLFEARLHPERLARDLTPAEARRLRKAIVTVLERAIDKRGSSIRDYVGGSGLKGQYQQEFRVYRRTGEPCVNCRTPIERICLAGRSTHFCPDCQGSEPEASAPGKRSR